MKEQTHRILGIDGGATKTEWALFDEKGGELTLIEQGSTKSGNYKLASMAELHHRLMVMPQEADAVGIYLAGCVNVEDQAEIAELARLVWPKAKISAGSDRDSAYAAAFLDEEGIIVLAGTGSAVTGKSDLKEERAGGWGHVLGDAGSGYDLSVRMLRRILWDYDVEKSTGPFATDVLRTLHFPTLSALSDWALNATKSEIAALSPLVFRHESDPEIQEILETGADTLATYCEAVARRLKIERPRICLFGGLFHSHQSYGERFRKHAIRRIPHCVVANSPRPTSWGAAWLASHKQRERVFSDGERQLLPEAAISSSDTELSNPRSRNLDTMSLPEMVHLFVEEERELPNAVEVCEAAICTAVEGIVRALNGGGRLFYLGAGTSGRLGVLDASEIPPTFGMAADRVQGLIAGGRGALWSSVEGAEDDFHAGVVALKERNLCRKDVVCGIAASGQTPYVLGAMEYARKCACFTIFLTCNPGRKHADKIADVEIDLPTGAEILAGSTRLKAGTATKIVLNILSTCAMVRLGRVTGNQMTSLRPTNFKLRERAVGIVSRYLHCDAAEARKLLSRNGWDVAALTKGK